jgi:hypothetical protein
VGPWLQGTRHPLQQAGHLLQGLQLALLLLLLLQLQLQQQCPWLCW